MKEGILHTRLSRRDLMKYAVAGAGAAVLGRDAIENAQAQEAANSVKEAFRAEGALNYPMLKMPNPDRQHDFPDVPTSYKGVDRPALVGYDKSFENGDYFQTGKGDVDVPQWYFRVITTGKTKIDQLGIDLEASTDEDGNRIGTVAILVNHFGDTAMFRDAEADNGFTVAGPVWDMSTPELVTEAAQALLDHYTYRSTQTWEGANCGQQKACTGGVDFAVSVFGNSEPQALWTGRYTPGAAQAA